MAMSAARLRSPLPQTTGSLVSERELTRRRIARALQDRQRYRYVKPAVTTTEDGWLITSPCCSRNIDPEGGVIDIARLSRQDEQWSLFMREREHGGWVLHSGSDRLATLLKCLCEDDERVFWP